MSAPVLANRMMCAVQKIGTDDAGYNTVGHPECRLTIAAALADLAANYPAASSTNFHIVALGPGFYSEGPLVIPPWTFIEGTCDGESQPTAIISLVDGLSSISLSAAWSANASARGGLSNVTIQAASGSPILDFTMPVPVAGNPTRVVELDNLHWNLTNLLFEATGTGDVIRITNCKQFGVATDAITLEGGTSLIKTLMSAAAVVVNDTGAIAVASQIYDLDITSATGGVTFSTTTGAGVTARMGACDNRNLTLNKAGAGTLAVTADQASIPLRANVFVTGTATVAANLILSSDAAGDAYTPATPGNWSPVPTTVQQALDELGNNVAPLVSVPAGLFTVENVNLPAGTSQKVNILTVAPGNSGVVKLIQFAFQGVAGGSGAQKGNLLYDSKINIQIDGAVAPGQQSDLGTFFKMHGAPTVFATDDQAVTFDTAGGDWGGYVRVEIPFSNGIVIDIQNQSTASNANIYSQVAFEVGAAPVSNRKVWHSRWTTVTSVAQYGAIDLLPAVAGAGEIESVYLIVLSNVNYGYLEGNVQWTIDGVPLIWGGTEDYFGGQFYWAGGTFQTNTWGAKQAAQLQQTGGNAFSTAMYHRHFPRDRLPFSASAQLTWNNGQNGEGSPPGAVNILALVTYWTAA